jgi:nucleotide-binding universal stress UspA family protein
MTKPQPMQLSPLARFERILVATDGSPFSADAVKVAIAMCVKSGAHLYPFNMVLTNPEYEALAPELVEKASEDIKAHLESVIAEAGRQGVGSTMLMRLGDRPDVEIMAAAEEINADLIVMGQQGRRGLARMMVGDATLRVIGSAVCSVLSVPVGAGMWHNRILLGTDGSRFADAAAVSAAKIAHCCAAPITIVSALVPSHSEARKEEGREAVKRTTAQLRQDGLDVDGVALPGEADDVLIKLAEERRADLIVVGTHGRTGFGKVLLGSVSERVIGKAKCAVLVVKA